MSDCKTSRRLKRDECRRQQLSGAPHFLCFACHNFPVTYLFELRDRLPGGCRGNDGPVAPRAELQGQRESGNQLHPQLRHTHFVVHHPDAPLSQHRRRHRGQHLRQVNPHHNCRWIHKTVARAATAKATQPHRRTSRLTWTAVAPTARPCTTTPSSTLATSGSATLRELRTRLVTSTCQSKVKRHKLVLMLTANMKLL